MRPKILKRLYADTEITSYKAIAADLGYRSVGNLHAAAVRGAPVNGTLIAAIKARFPLVRYEDVFMEGVVRDVPAAKQAA